MNNLPSDRQPQCDFSPTAAPHLVARWRLGQACARDIRLKRASLAVMLVISDHVNGKTGEAWPSIARVALLAGVSTRTAQRGVRQLVSLGYLCERRVAGRATRYRLIVPGSNATLDSCDTPDSGAVPGTTLEAEGDDKSVPTPVTHAPLEPTYPTKEKNQLKADRRSALADIVNLPLPKGLTRDSWMAYVLHREKMKTPLRLSAASAASCLRKLEALAGEGLDLNAIALRSVARGWLDLYSTPPQRVEQHSATRAPTDLEAEEMNAIAAAKLNLMGLRHGAP